MNNLDQQKHIFWNGVVCSYIFWETLHPKTNNIQIELNGLIKHKVLLSELYN